MADGITTMFGKAYDTVGSADKNLILQTRGDLKVKWGGKYIDLIKNGKINVDVDLLKKVDSKDSIYKDGLYLIEGEETQEVWLSIGGTLVNLLGEIGTTYVSYVAPQDVDAEGKFRALSNIGFFYESLEAAQTAKIQQGLIYVLAENQLYYAKEGNLVKYEPQLNVPNPLVIGTITIDGNAGNIYGTKDISFGIGSNNYLKLADNKVQVNQELVTYKNLESWDFVGSQKGYILTTTENDESLLEVDIIRVRKYIDYSNKVKLTYSQLLNYISQKKLIEGKEYVIIDFQNEWEVTEPQLTYLEDDETHVPNVHPITVTATSYNKISKTAYVEGHPEWVIQYDINYKHFIRTYTQTDENGNEKTYDLYTKGKITKMIDELGNEANYDFKHRLFKHTSSSTDDQDWFFTFNIVNSDYTADSITWEEHHTNMDATQQKGSKIKNNVIYIKEPVLTQRNGGGYAITIPDDYILFPDCSTTQPYDNEILDSRGKYTITGNFYNNKFKGLYDNSGQTIQFTLDFHDNTFQKVQNCVLNAPMQYNTFDRNLINVAFQCTSMSNNHITGIIYTNNARDSYPIQVANFNNNIINNINMSAINCSGCDIANNIINNINGCTITNSTLTDITMKDITGDGQYEMNPTDNIDDSQVNPGGDTPVDPGGDPSSDSVEYYGTTWYATPQTFPGNGYTQYSIVVSNTTYYAWLPDTIDVNGVTYSTTQPTSPGNDYTLNTIQRYGVNYYAWIYNDPNCSGCSVGMSRFVSGAQGYGGPAPGSGLSGQQTIGQFTPATGCTDLPTFSIEKATSEPMSDAMLAQVRAAWAGVTFTFSTQNTDEEGHSRTNTYFVVASSIPANPSTSAIHFYLVPSCNPNDHISFNQAAGSGSSSGGETPTGDADVDEYLNTFKSSSLSSTTLSNEKYSLLSTAMDKLDTFESSVMSDSMFVDDVYTLPSGNSTDTRNARRGWFMGLLLTALYPMTGSTTVNNAILTDAMSNWGISQSTDTNTYSVSTYEAKYKGLLQGSIAFSWLFSDSSFVNSFASHASYTYQESDGDLGAGSTLNYYHAPQGQYFFPYPPTNNISATSGLMKRDEDAFNAGKSLRDNNSSRAILATTNKDQNDNPIGDVNTSLKYYIRILNAVTGKKYSETPSKGSLLYDTHWNGNRTVNLIKNTGSFWRNRPAWENNDTSVDSDTYDLNFGNASGKSGSTSNTTSYPSGHTGYLWNTAYCYAAVGGLSNSAVVNLFKRAYQYSESRVIAGAHWQMCVEMGRIAAACSFATLCGNTKFIEELQAAQS